MTESVRPVVDFPKGSGSIDVDSESFGRSPAGRFGSVCSWGGRAINERPKMVPAAGPIVWVVQESGLDTEVVVENA